MTGIFSKISALTGLLKDYLKRGHNFPKTVKSFKILRSKTESFEYSVRGGRGVCDRN
jgi:hypothetical protein